MPWLSLLDRLRARLLRGLLRRLGDPMRVVLRRPDLRVGLLGVTSVLFSALLTWWSPLWMLAISPILLGIPHLVADVRYLVIRPGYHQRLWLAVPIALLLAAVAAGGGMPAGLVAVACTLLLAQRQRRTHLLRRALGLVLVGGIAWWGHAGHWYELELALAHLHNYIAVVLLYVWLRPGTSSGPSPSLAWVRWLPAAVIVLWSGLILLGWIGAAPGSLSVFAPDNELSLEWAQWTLAPELSPHWATRVVLLFAFAQAVHYTVWLRLWPEVARGRPTPRSFTETGRALRRDLGGAILVVAATAAICLILLAGYDLAGTRASYFRIALFHGYLELCALALVLVEGLPRPEGLREASPAGAIRTL